MRTDSPKTELVWTKAERPQFQSFARSRSLPAAPRVRARTTLDSANGGRNTKFAERLKLSIATAGK